MSKSRKMSAPPFFHFQIGVDSASLAMWGVVNDRAALPHVPIQSALCRKELQLRIILTLPRYALLSIPMSLPGEMRWP